MVEINNIAFQYFYSEYESRGGSSLVYGARFFDNQIGRFTGVDPISADFAHVSTYNYAENSPVTNIDLHGLQALFAADGSLVGYSVQEGQGPTQIAEDLNENYSCELTCEIDYTDIVQDNSGQFENALNDDGLPKDKFDDSYKSGNIDPGDVLNVTDGKVNSESSVNADLEVLDKKIDSISREISGQHLRSLNYNEMNDYSRKYEKSGKAGVGINAGNTMSASRNEQDSVNSVKERDALIKKRDSLKNTPN